MLESCGLGFVMLGKPLPNGLLLNVKGAAETEEMAESPIKETETTAESIMN